MKIGGPKTTDVLSTPLGAPAVARTAPIAPPAAPEAPLGRTRAPRRDEVPASLPPAGASLLGAPALERASGTLDTLAAATIDARAAEIMSRAARAAADVARMTQVSTPLRLTLKEDKTRPATIEAFLDRGVGGPADDPRPKVQLTPTDRSIRPFPVDASAVEGLRAGARVKLVLERTEDDQQVYAVKADESSYAASFLAHVVVENGQAFAVGNATSPVFGRVPLPGGAALAGQAVVVDVADPSSASKRSGTVRQVLGDAGGLSARLMEAALREGVSVGHSAAAMAEVKALLADPPITGKDLTHLPFITIDNVGSKDLDQAMCIQKRADGGYDVHYAIADVAHFIKPDSALDREARRRTQTMYLADGHNIPMLPRELSEGLISLLPNEKRRAFVVTVSLDEDGEVQSRSFQRGVVESKKQMAYTQVQSFVDGGMKGDLAGQPWSENLTLLRELGAKRVAKADARGVVPSDEGGAHLGVSDGKIVVKHEGRNQVEKWNEQISLLANEAVGAELRTRNVKALFRTHPAPPPEKVDAFRDMVGALGFPWPEAQSLADYVRSLDPAHPMTSIIHGLSSTVNVPASYQTSYAGGHSGLKLDDYVHFTAPMRRYTDVVVARILGALVEGTPVPYQKPNDRTLGQVQHLAEEVRRREGNLAGREGTLLTAEWFADKLGQPLEATIVGVRPAGVKVALTGSDVVLTVPAAALGGAGTLESAGTAFVVGGHSYAMGQPITVTGTGVDPATGRVALSVS